MCGREVHGNKKKNTLHDTYKNKLVLRQQTETNYGWNWGVQKI